MIAPRRITTGLFFLSLLLIACGGGSQLTYKVSGSAAEAAVTYTDDNGETIEETVSLPWEISYEFKGTFDFELMANNTGETGTVVCEVWADERPVSGVQGHQFAECAGSITITKRGGSTETSSNFSSRSDELDGTVVPTATPAPTPTPLPPVEVAFNGTRFMLDGRLADQIYPMEERWGEMTYTVFKFAPEGVCREVGCIILITIPIDASILLTAYDPAQNKNPDAIPLPVELPADYWELSQVIFKYNRKVERQLDLLPTADFIPGFDLLDALVASLHVEPPSSNEENAP